MGKISKTVALLLTLIIAMSCLTVLMVKPANAQSIRKPSIPEFKLSYTSFVYDVPAATSQWSGEPIPDTAQHYDYREVYIKVRNAPNDAMVNDSSFYNGVGEHLYYNVRVKSHLSNDWVELWGQSPVYADNGSIITGTWYWGASDSEVTIVGSINFNGPTNIIHASKDVAVGNQVDFQVKALIGHQNFEKHSFFGEESEWSQTQTLDFSVASTSTPNPSSLTTSTPTSTQITPDINTNSVNLPLNTFIIIIAALALTIVVLSIMLVRMHRKTANLTQ